MTFLSNVALGLLVLYVVVPIEVKSQVCPTDYANHPLLLISMDGFRYDYLARGLTPTIQAFQDSGVSTPFMKPSYPSITFPNHYTIVTGLYPESHGIIGNHFYDSNFGASFDLGDPDTLNGSWWGGDPIWNTVQKQGKKSATFFWPGSDADIEGMYPNYYYVYDGSIPFEDRNQQVLDWLALPEGERPDFISLYFDEPDHTGHSFGPDTQEVDDMLVYMDVIFKNLTDGIEAMGLKNCVNIILLADHGMSTAGSSRVVNLANYDANIRDKGYIEYGPFGMIYIDDGVNPDDVRMSLSCQQPEMRQYNSASMPTRTHFSNNIRIAEVLLDLNTGYAIDVGDPGETGDTLFYLEGQHGYDPLYEVMQPFFIAGGPDFREGATIEPFQNIEVYDLMCSLLGVVPSPNNGTEGSLYHLLKNPPSYPSSATEIPPPTPEFPDETTLESRLNIAGCAGDYSSPPAWVYGLNMTSQEMTTAEETHLPWGIPHSGDLPVDVLLLHHLDHVTGYSSTLKMPLWTSFTISEHTSGSSVASWTSDVRLSSSNTPTCDSYAPIASQNVAMEPLFPRRYSANNTYRDIPYLASNAVPMTPESVIHWTEITYNFLSFWQDQALSPLNVIMGPVFDNNYDSLVDNFTMFNSTPEVPSHFFMVVTRCLGNSSLATLTDCSPTSALDSIAFILPQQNTIPNCMTTEDYALKFSAKVKDVEIATGLTFFPDLSYEERTKLAIRIHSNLWYS